ncbi:hypothetical protein DL98DRAFT_518894 [Cadophora sp. DSE1049]|nr:hypothetical protein DL98DRAFT_518894 [Cadophora sp. DSE1049]
MSSLLKASMPGNKKLFDFQNSLRPAIRLLGNCLHAHSLPPRLSCQPHCVALTLSTTTTTSATSISFGNNFHAIGSTSNLSTLATHNSHSANILDSQQQNLRTDSHRSFSIMRLQAFPVRPAREALPTTLPKSNRQNSEYVVPNKHDLLRDLANLSLLRSPASQIVIYQDFLDVYSHPDQSNCHISIRTGTYTLRMGQRWQSLSRKNHSRIEHRSPERQEDHSRELELENPQRA